MKKKFIQFFQDKSFGQKKRPLRDAARQQKKKRKTWARGTQKRAPQKGRKKNGHGWSLSIGPGEIL